MYILTCQYALKVRGMMLIKEPLLLIGKSSPCNGNGLPLSLSELSFTICLKVQACSPRDQRPALRSRVSCLYIYICVCVRAHMRVCVRGWVCKPLIIPATTLL